MSLKPKKRSHQRETSSWLSLFANCQLRYPACEREDRNLFKCAAAAFIAPTCAQTPGTANKKGEEMHLMREPLRLIGPSVGFSAGDLITALRGAARGDISCDVLHSIRDDPLHRRLILETITPESNYRRCSQQQQHADDTLAVSHCASDAAIIIINPESAGDAAAGRKVHSKFATLGMSAPSARRVTLWNK